MRLPKVMNVDLLSSLAEASTRGLQGRVETGRLLRVMVVIRKDKNKECKWI